LLLLAKKIVSYFTAVCNLCVGTEDASRVKIPQDILNAAEIAPNRP
jgi:hypothetical protein